MVRAPFYDKNGLKKGAWSQEEDERLRAYIQSHGHSNWRQLPKFAGLARCGKSCRLRWLNYLRPNLKHGDYTREEEEIIIKLHQQFGKRWSKIAEKLPGRTDNEIKNYWHSHLKKLLKSEENTTTYDQSKSKEGDNFEGNVRSESPESNVCDGINLVLESSLPVSTETLEGDNYSSTSCSAMNLPRPKDTSVAAPWVIEDFGGDFWTQPFVVEDSYSSNVICSDEGIALSIPNFYDGAYLL